MKPNIESVVQPDEGSYDATLLKIVEGRTAQWRNDGWREAVLATEAGDNTLLVAKLMHPDTVLGHYMQHILGDLLQRHVLVKPRGRPRQPLHSKSTIETSLRWAGDQARVYIMDGLNREDAVALAAKNFDVDPVKLQNLIDGKRGSSRRKNKR